MQKKTRHNGNNVFGTKYLQGEILGIQILTRTDKLTDTESKIYTRDLYK